MRRLDTEHSGEALPRLVTQRQHALEVRLAGSSIAQVALCLLDDCCDGRAMERPRRSRVQVRVALEHGELCACLLEGHPTRSSTGA